MCNYGNGFTMMDLYKMPTRLRIFYYKKLIDAKKKEQEQLNKSQSSVKSNKGTITRVKK
jgi:hypothetical protein